MQFSADEGDTWTTYPTTGAEQDRNVNWSFTFTPAASGHYRLLVRAVGGDGRITPEPALVHLSVSEASRAPRELL